MPDTKGSLLSRGMSKLAREIGIGPAPQEYQDSEGDFRKALEARLAAVSGVKGPAVAPDWRSITRAGEGDFPSASERSGREQATYKAEGLRQLQEPPFMSPAAKAIMEGLRIHREGLWRGKPGEERV